MNRSTPQAFQPTAGPWLYLDSRSLSLFRWCLAFSLFWTAIDFLPHLEAFYGAHAMVPADAIWAGYIQKPWPFSLLFLFPDSTMPALCTLLVMMASALLLATGRLVRLAAFAGWLAYGSLLAGNLLLQHAGDNFLMIMLLAACFLPVNDHLRPGPVHGSQPEQPRFYCNFFTSLWILQLAVIYAVAGWVKLTSASWRDGSHLERLFSATEFITPFGQWLTEFPFLLRIGTWTSLGLEVSLPFLLLSVPSRWQLTRIQDSLIAESFDSLPSETDRFGGARWRFFLFGRLLPGRLPPSSIPGILRYFGREIPPEIARQQGVRLELVLYQKALPPDPDTPPQRRVLGHYDLDGQPANR